MKHVENFAGTCPGASKCTKTDRCANKTCSSAMEEHYDRLIAQDVAAGLAGQGFARFSLGGQMKKYAGSLVELQATASNMPLDLTDGGFGRARLYGRYYMMPWMPLGENLVAEPGRVNAFNGTFGLEYTQPASVNSAAAGKRRVFKTFDDRLYKNRLLVDLVNSLFDAAPFDPDTKAGAFVVGVHLVKLAPMGDKEAVASPPLVHRDGEPYTAAVLINRVNAKGGFNAITRPEWHDRRMDEVTNGDVLDLFTLETPLEGYIVDDLKVAHYVSPVGSVDRGRPAERTVLLIDYTPARPQIVLDGIG